MSLNLYDWLVLEVRDFRDNAVNWAMGCILIYSSLFGLRKMIFGQWVIGALLPAFASLAGWVIFWDLSRRGWQTFSGAGTVSTPPMIRPAGEHAS